jgi:hypothetical protein
MYTEYVIIAIVFSILLFEPNILKSFSNTIYGRILFVLAITGATLYKTYLGLLLVLVLVTLNGVNNIEGMSNKDVDEFRETNCKGDKLYKGDDLVSISQVSKMFPNVKFSKNQCNPCDSNCSFSISTTTEQLSVEEDLKPKSSKQFRTSKEQVVGNSEPGPSPPIRISKNKSANSSQIEK